MDIDIKKLNLGIIHNTYLKKGGEDFVAQSEYQLLKANGFNIHYLQFVNPEGWLKQLFVFLLATFNPFSFFKCYRWLKQNNIGLLHVHNWFFAASPSVFWAAKLCKVPVVATLHNYRMICPSGTFIFEDVVYDKSMYTSFAWDAVKLGVYRNSSILTFNLAFVIWFNKAIGTWYLVKKYMVLTEHSKYVINKSHLKGLGERLVTKPNFVYPIYLDNTITRGNNFLFVGRLSNEKGIRLLMDAFRGSIHQLTIIGEGPLQKEVESFAIINKNVTYLNYQDKVIINKELQSCTALLFPSIWYETFGLIVIEAFACGTPVIASNLASTSILVKDGFNGLHFEPSDVKSFKQKINEWSGFNNVEKARVSKNAYQSYLSTYTPERNLEQLIQIYQSVIK